LGKGELRSLFLSALLLFMGAFLRVFPRRLWIGTSARNSSCTLLLVSKIPLSGKGKTIAKDKPQVTHRKVIRTIEASEALSQGDIERAPGCCAVTLSRVENGQLLSISESSPNRRSMDISLADFFPPGPSARRDRETQKRLASSRRTKFASWRRCHGFLRFWPSVSRDGTVWPFSTRDR